MGIKRDHEKGGGLSINSLGNNRRILANKSSYLHVDGVGVIGMFC